MHPLLGLSFTGATLTPFDDLRRGTGALGHPVWGPAAFLRDLELRLGLGGAFGGEAVRVTRWAARMAELAPRGRFYSTSFEQDPLGTARAVLDLRDELVDAGWRGTPIADGSTPLPRLDAIVELERASSLPLPAGTADRVAAVACALQDGGTPIYDAVTLAEPATSWSATWQQVFRALERQGTSMARLTATLPGANRSTDLGRVQAALAGAPAAPGAPRMNGDGSLLLVTAETSAEAAAFVAALLANLPAGGSVVIRDAEAQSLDHALCVQGEPTQGHRPASPWRPMLQVLPLALELAFEPKDPRRALDLLGLPRGPFAGAVGRRLREALTRFPGIGGRAWREAKERIVDDRDEWLGRIAEWFEAPGADSNRGAPKADLLGIVARVRAWLLSKVPLAPEDPVLFAAIERCDALAEVLEAEPRTAFDRVSLRRIVELVQGEGAPVEVQPELAGRVGHVSFPGALWVPRDTVVWWSFSRGYDVGRTTPWRKAERLALERAGIHLPDAAQRLLERAEGHRRAVSAATERLILVAPVTAIGQRRPAHPLWDEIVGRLDLDDADVARIARAPGDLLSGSASNTPRVAVVPASPLSLPVGAREWSLDASDLPAITKHASTSLTALLGCPLRWVLATWARLRSEHDALPAPNKLSGELGHRLVEELFRQGAFDLAEAEFLERATDLLDVLFEQEGAILLEPGKAHEKEHLVRVLTDAAQTLFAALRGAGYSIASVEEAFAVEWMDAKLDGRWDLLARRGSGQHALIDLKWGRARYRDMLRQGRALQLALYAHAAEQRYGRVPADYFSLKARRWFGLNEPDVDVPDREVIDGPSLEDVHQRAQRTVNAVTGTLREGRVPVSGVRGSLPLLDALGIDPDEQARHLALFKTPDDTCKYCQFDGICGRRWEVEGLS